jgi:sterol desaturase/sphingolipid hydroxylase (fatty acid hydroxylase superfamily)
MIDYTWGVAGIFGGFILLEVLMGRFFQKQKSDAKDVILECTAVLVIPVLIIPMTIFLGGHLVELLAPGSQGAWSDWSWGLMFLVLLLGDDLTQYWWHRLSHSVPWLYGFHRAHHSGRYLSVRVVYRNSLLYYVFMPGLWIASGLIYLGFGEVYVVYIIAKMTVIISAHSSVLWDQSLLRNRYSRPLMWWVVRIISTPTTHAAHHGRHADDGVTHYKGNYGNFLFFWDVLFGTAQISDDLPAEYGIEGMAPATWFEELIWPGRGKSG